MYLSMYRFFVTMTESNFLKVSASTGSVVQTIAGRSTTGSTNGIGTVAFMDPYRVLVSSDGSTIYYSDTTYAKIKRISLPWDIEIKESDFLCDFIASTNVMTKVATNTLTWSCENVENRCSWPGVTCGLAGVIIESISLVDLSITGTIPESISALTNLEILHLNGNDLGVVYPSSLCSMTGLTSFHFTQTAYHECYIPTSLPTEEPSFHPSLSPTSANPTGQPTLLQLESTFGNLLFILLNIDLNILFSFYYRAPSSIFFRC